MIYTYSRLGTHGAAGNQLWEIAGTVGTALTNNAQVRLPDWPYKKYFSIPDSVFGPMPEGAQPIDLYPDYLQDLKHWGDSESTITDWLTFSDYMWEQLFKNYGDILNIQQELTSVHVRRANNLKLPDHHPVCPITYFEKALDQLKPSQVVVFSDDLEWCRKQNLFKDAYFAKGNDPSIDTNLLTNAEPLFLDSVMLDLGLMGQCDQHVISNSSFSWWGAYLSYAPDVIYPARWYGPALKHIDISGMFPRFWQRLDLEKW